MMLGGGGVLINALLLPTFRHQAGLGLSVIESPLFAEAIDGALGPVSLLSVDCCSSNEESKEAPSSVGKAISRVNGDIVDAATGLNIVSMRYSVARTLCDDARPLNDEPRLVGWKISSGARLGFSIISSSLRNLARWNPGLESSPETCAKISPFCNGGARYIGSPPMCSNSIVSWRK